MTTPFSVRLSAVLKSRGMSQTDLAAALGLTPSAVNRYVNGNRVPSIEVTLRTYPIRSLVTATNHPVVKLLPAVPLAPNRV